MNALAGVLFSDALVQRIGWALIHFLWQGAVVALLLAAALQCLRRSAPQVRCAAACLALGLMALAPVVTACMVSVEVADPAGVAQVREEAPGLGAAGLTAVTVEASDPARQTPVGTEPLGVAKSLLPAAGRAEGPTASLHGPSVERPGGARASAPATSWPVQVESSIRSVLPWGFLIWLAGVSGMSLWHLGGWVALARTKQHGTRPVAQALREVFGRLLRRLRISRPVRLLASARVAVPMVVGWFRPVVLLPASMLCGLSPAQLEAVLAHELAHIRRCDCLVRLLQAVVDTLLFYHPAVWWVSRRIRQESEHCCDEVAIAVCPDRRSYAQALARVAELSGRDPHLAAAASGGKLLPRIRRIVGLPGHEPGGGARWMTGAVVVVSLLAVGSLIGGCPPQGRAQPPVAAPRPAARPAKASFETFTAAITSTWPWNRAITIRGDGTCTFVLQQLKKVPGEERYVHSDEPYVARYRLSAGHLRQLEQLLKDTGWLAKPGRVNPRLKDGMKYSLSLLRSGKETKTVCHGRQEEAYRNLVEFLARIDRQEWVRFKLTDTTRDWSPVLTMVNSELDWALGKRHTVKRYAPPLDYRRLVPALERIRKEGKPQRRDPARQAIEKIRKLLERQPAAPPQRHEQLRKEVEKETMAQAVHDLMYKTYALAAFLSPSSSPEGLFRAIEQHPRVAKLMKIAREGSDADRKALRAAILRECRTYISKLPDYGKEGTPWTPTVMSPGGGVAYAYLLRHCDPNAEGLPVLVAMYLRRQDASRRYFKRGASAPWSSSKHGTVLAYACGHFLDTYLARKDLRAKATPKQRQVLADHGTYRRTRRAKDVDELRLMRFAVAFVRAAALPLAERAAEGGPPVGGLKLTLSADKTETVMKADGSNVEPVSLRIKFTNTGKEPLKLDAFLPWARRLIVEVTGPDGRRVKRLPPGLTRTVRSPAVNEFPQLAPGKHHHVAGRIGAPLLTYSVFPYSFRKPGEYRVRVRYVSPAPAGVPDHEHLARLSKGCWSGEIVSNAIDLTVRPAPKEPKDAMVWGEAIEGLQVGIRARMKTLTAGRPFPIRWAIRNVGATDRAIIWHPLHYSPVFFEIGKPGERKHLLGDVRRLFTGRLPEPPTKLTLRPGQTKQATFDLSKFLWDNPAAGVYEVTGVYAPGASGTLKEFLAKPELKEVVTRRIDSKGIRVGIRPAADRAERAKVDAGRIAQLIERLGDASHPKRSAAEAELVEIGPPAIPALRAATADEDPERSERAKSALARIEKDVEDKRVQLRDAARKAAAKGDVAAATRSYAALLALPGQQLRDCRAAVRFFEGRQDWAHLAPAWEATAKAMRRVARTPAEQFIRPATPREEGARDRGPIVQVQTALDGNWSNGRGTAANWLPRLQRKQKDMEREGFFLLCKVGRLYRDRLHQPKQAGRAFATSLAEVRFCAEPLDTLIARCWPVRSDMRKEISGTTGWSSATMAGAYVTTLRELAEMQVHVGDLRAAIESKTRQLLGHFILGWNYRDGLTSRCARELWALAHKLPPDAPLPPLFWFNVLSRDRDTITFDLSKPKAKPDASDIYDLNVAARPGHVFDTLEVTADMEGAGGHGEVNCYTVFKKQTTVGRIQWHDDRRKGRDQMTRTFKVPEGARLIRFHMYLYPRKAEGFRIHRITVKARFRPSSEARNR